MLRSLRCFAVALVPTLAACTGVMSLQSAVKNGGDTFDPRLIGDWTWQDGQVVHRFAVAREGAARYLVRYSPPTGSPLVFEGRFGRLGARRWIFELSPAGDTSHFNHHLAGDSSRLDPPDLPMMMPVRMQLVLEPADTGLRFAMFDGDTLLAALRDGRLHTPYALKSYDIAGAVVLGEIYPDTLNAVLAAWADKPGTLVPLPRVGRAIRWSDKH